MGCANSKLNPEGTQVQVVPPRIRGRFLELRTKRRNGTNLRHGTLSKKQLLLKDTTAFALDQPNSNSNSNSNSMLLHNTTISLVDHGTTNSSTPQFTIHHHHGDSTNHNFRTASLDHLVAFTKQDEENNEDGHQAKKPTEEGTSDNEEDRCIICPGSPSFRVYFVEETININDKQNVQTKDIGMEDVSRNKPPSHDSIESTPRANFSEGQVNKMIKKGVSFKRGISKRRPVGVKKLLNVKSCYHIGCSGNDRASLLARKAEA